MRAANWSPLAILICAVCVGCGGSQPQIAKVTGKITLDGQPLSRAAIIFNPVNGRPAGATTDENGYYTLNFTEGRQGALLGLNKVVITTRRDPWRDENGKVQPASGERLPAKYNAASTLTYEVEEGKENVANFDLDSSGRIARSSDES